MQRRQRHDSGPEMNPPYHFARTVCLVVQWVNWIALPFFVFYGLSKGIGQGLGSLVVGFILAAVAHAVVAGMIALFDIANHTAETNELLGRLLNK